MSVIDAALRFSQNTTVLTEPEIRAELVRQLDAKTIKGKVVAAYLGIPATRVTEMRRGTRRVQQKELAPLAQLLGMQVTRLPDQDELISMLEDAQREVSFGVSIGDYPHAVASSLHAQLLRYAGIQPIADVATEGTSTGLGEVVPPRAPTKRSARG